MPQVPLSASLCTTAACDHVLLLDHIAAGKQCEEKGTQQNSTDTDRSRVAAAAAETEVVV